MNKKEAQSLLNKKIDRNEKAISNAILKLENSIILLAAGIDTKPNGTIAAPSVSLPQSRAFLRETQKAFNEIYLTEVETTLDFKDIDSLVQKGLKTTFAGTTSTTLRALIINDRNFHESLSSQTQDRLNETVIDHVINGSDKNDLIMSIRNILTGIKDAGGRPMSSHAETITQDSLMEYYASASIMTAKQAGIDKFEYFGTLIKDSRQWCAKHVNEAYTLAEIKQFDDDSWAGKKPGPTIINRGGYNCRHSWLPIVE